MNDHKFNIFSEVFTVGVLYEKKKLSLKTGSIYEETQTRKGLFPVETAG